MRKPSHKAIITKMYASMVQRAKLRHGSNLDFTKAEFTLWVHNTKLLPELYRAWEESGYGVQSIPSIDRLDDYKTYTLCNIQLITWGENQEKYYADVASGKNTKTCKAVTMSDMLGTKIRDFTGATQAAEFLGSKSYRGNITSCCGKLKKSAYGYTWKFQG